jgi:hypothetical protein
MGAPDNDAEVRCASDWASSSSAAAEKQLSSMSAGDRPSPEEIERRLEEGKAWTRETEAPRAESRPSGPPPPPQRRASQGTEAVRDTPPTVAPPAQTDES